MVEEDDAEEEEEEDGGERGGGEEGEIEEEEYGDGCSSSVVMTGSTYDSSIYDMIRECCIPEASEQRLYSSDGPLEHHMAGSIPQRASCGDGR